MSSGNTPEKLPFNDEQAQLYTSAVNDLLTEMDLGLPLVQASVLKRLDAMAERIDVIEVAMTRIIASTDLDPLHIHEQIETELAQFEARTRVPRLEEGARDEETADQ